MPKGIKKDERMFVLEQACKNITESWHPTPTAVALVKLFERTARLGRFGLDFLSRIPCDEVIALARTIKRRSTNEDLPCDRQAREAAWARSQEQGDGTL